MNKKLATSLLVSENVGFSVSALSADYVIDIKGASHLFSYDVEAPEKPPLK